MSRLYIGLLEAFAELARIKHNEELKEMVEKELKKAENEISREETLPKKRKEREE